MNRIECTGITYSDGTKRIMFYVDEITNSTNISTVSYPRLTSEEIDDIRNVTIDRLQKLLSNYF